MLEADSPQKVCLTGAMQFLYFQGVDLVPTDIAAGLILVHREQERKALRLSSVSVERTRPRSASYETFSANTSSDIERLELTL